MKLLAANHRRLDNGFRLGGATLLEDHMNHKKEAIDTPTITISMSYMGAINQILARAIMGESQLRFLGHKRF